MIITILKKKKENVKQNIGHHFIMCRAIAGPKVKKKQVLIKMNKGGTSNKIQILQAKLTGGENRAGTPGTKDPHGGKPNKGRLNLKR